MTPREEFKTLSLDELREKETICCDHIKDIQQIVRRMRSEKQSIDDIWPIASEGILLTLTLNWIREEIEERKL